MTEISIELMGEDNLKRKINNVSEELTNGELLLRVGYKIEAQAKINASGRPGPNVQTGRLRTSINTQLSPDKMEVFVGTNVFYAPFVELGHKQTPGRFVPAIGKRLVKSFAPAYPFMMPSLEQTEASGEMEGVLGSFCNDLELGWGL